MVFFLLEFVNDEGEFLRTFTNVVEDDDNEDDVVESQSRLLQVSPLPAHVIAQLLFRSYPTGACLCRGPVLVRF